MSTAKQHLWKTGPSAMLVLGPVLSSAEEKFCGQEGHSHILLPVICLPPYKSNQRPKQIPPGLGLASAGSRSALEVRVHISVSPDKLVQRLESSQTPAQDSFSSFEGISRPQRNGCQADDKPRESPSHACHPPPIQYKARLPRQTPAKGRGLSF